MNAQPIIKQFFYSNIFTPIFTGIGLSYSIEKEKYLHIPIVLTFPSVYFGYQLYKNHHIFISKKNRLK